MNNAEYWIKKLSLEKHPEGGWYREVYKSGEQIKHEHLPDRFTGSRHHSTSIYFLLKSGEFSALHRIKSDELWHFYKGSPVTIHIINARGEYSKLKLGDGEFQCVIPHGSWFGASVDEPDSFTLAGCTVAPGFHFDDFELGKRDALINQFPNCKEVIERLTRE